MRKDKGLNGDLDRLPLFTWVMFLKFLDDIEMQREQKASLAGKKYRPAIEAPYRWRDWAAKEDGISGPELLAFINQDEAMRPDGKRGPGLLAYLRGLPFENGGDPRRVIANVFSGVVNRMESGYLLRDIINKVNGIHFGSTEEIHTLGHLYESMLKEMRDAAGDYGEFYTPRAVVRFMVAVTDPKTRRNHPRSGLWHRRLSRRGLRPSRKAGQESAGSRNPADAQHLRRRGQAAALYARPDELAFADCLKWWKKRVENDRAQKVPAEELLANNCNLARKNPNAKPDIEYLPPEQLVESILEKDRGHRPRESRLAEGRGIGNNSGKAAAKGGEVVTEPKLVLEVNDDPVHGAQVRAQLERAKRNGDWLAAHWADVFPAARGRHVAVAGQQAFIADTAAEAWSMAKAAHPDDDGAIMQFVFKEIHARIYANQG